MGICFTKNRFKLNDKLGQDVVAANFFRMLGLENYDVSKFYDAFTEIDVKEIGIIKTSDLYWKYRCVCIIYCLYNNTSSISI